MDKITCDTCGKEYDESHIPDRDERGMVEELARNDGWVLRFMTECPTCATKVEDQNG